LEREKVLVAFLTATGLFEAISEEDARKVARLCSERAYPRGATIYSEGDPSDAVYILKAGLVKIVSFSEKGAETILYILKPDEIFGALLLAEETRPFTALALEDAVVTIIPRERLLELLGLVPTVALNFIKLLSQRVKKLGKELAEFSHSWSYHRLAKVLLELSEKYGEEVSTGILITLRLTHEDLANLIGTTRETVTTQINRFERMGLLSREDRHFIVNRSRLTEFIHSEEMRLSHL
jgi:CRP/FNR family transcriptional regulator